jgi:hypothetical protein
MTNEQQQDNFERAYAKRSVFTVSMLKAHRNHGGYSLSTVAMAWEGYKLAIADMEKQAAPVVPAPVARDDPLPPEYGETDFGFTFAGISLSEGDKRLMSMLVAAFGTAHPAIDDLTTLLFRARPQAPQAAPVAQLSEPPEGWKVLTPELLSDISQMSARKYWVADLKGDVLIGMYEWTQGRNPDGFATECGGRIGAREVTHIMPFNPPAAPTIPKDSQ